MFARLVEAGLAGTSGAVTELVHQQVVESFNGNKALVLAALFGEDLPQSKTQHRKAGPATTWLTTASSLEGPYA